ncbi:MAG TPA: hypothetical protein DCG04_08935 [Rhodospirillaceae bacterium]|nr:hypothetical protein [Rhodospirillaceae bacterium]MBB58480.1 hypothetical protein [Rhodospirillaceae bacterium]HAE01567.1 hypothetical protein [Rhodospirillaceae bacterium]
MTPCTFGVLGPCAQWHASQVLAKPGHAPIRLKIDAAETAGKVARIAKICDDKLIILDIL